MSHLLELPAQSFDLGIIDFIVIEIFVNLKGGPRGSIEGPAYLRDENRASCSLTENLNQGF
jgi:hypothetical protein